MSWFDVPKELRTALLAEQDITDQVGSRVHYQELPQSSDYPHVWFTRTSRERDRGLSGDAEMTVERFSLEVVSDHDAEIILDSIVSTMEAFEGECGDYFVQLVEVEDADDDYIFQSVGEGEPDYLHAVDIAVYVLPL